LFLGVAVCALPAQVRAQDASNAQQETTELPSLVVEGATVDKPKVKVKKPAPDQSSAAVPGPAGMAESSASGDGAGTETVSGIPADEIGSAVSVVTRAELQAQKVRHVAEALRSLPGVAVSKTGGFGSLTQVRIRGAEGNQTLVLIDGIDAGDTANGEFDLSNLLVEDIERIEVIRGGQSGIGGSKAIGGVINIITRDGKGPLTFMARAEGGSFGTRELAGRVSAGNDRFWFSLSGNARDSGGFNISPVGSEDDPWRIGTLNFKGGAVILPGVTLDVVFHKVNKDIDYDDFYALPGAPFATSVDGHQFNRTDIWLGGVNLTWNALDGALTQVVRANRNSTVTFDDNRDFSSPSKNINEADKYGYLATYRFGPSDFHSAVTGMVQKEEERFTPISAFTDGMERERSRIAYVGEWRGELFDRLFPTVTVRHDDNDVFADYTTWHAAASLKLTELGLRPHASVGTAVTLPGMYQMFGSILGDFQGNPNLNPEESFGWDAGVELSLWKGRALLDVTYFNADLTNEIGSTRTPSGDYFPINLAGKSERNGIEVSGRVAATKTLSFGASYTHLEAFEPNGLVEVRRPEHSGRADVNYVFDEGRGNLNVAAIYNGDMEDSAFDPNWAPNRVTLESYWLVNVAASYKLTDNVEIYGRVENALDQEYQEVYGNATPGISAYAGIRLTYEELQSKAWSQGR
jgi:vitamin B12 transporter